MISFSARGDFNNTERFLRKIKSGDLYRRLEPFAKEGATSLSVVTPRDSGATAGAWTYKIEITTSAVTITWLNTHMPSGFPVAISLQYGHGTGTGGWVQGRDYINPVMRPIFDRIADAVWKEVTSA